VPNPQSSPLPSRTLNELVAFDHCRVPLRHFAFLKRNDPVARLHAVALEVDPLSPKAVTAGERFRASVGYLFTCLRQSLKYYWIFGSHVRKNHGVGRIRQWRDIWHCMWRHNHLARHYYWRKHFLIRDRARWLDNLEHRELNTLLEYLNAQVPTARVADKIQFSQHCLTHFLPTPRVLAAWRLGGELLARPAKDPAADVFIKPTTDYGSVGAMAIPYDPVNATYRVSGKDVVWHDLILEVTYNFARKSPYVMQLRLRNSEPSAVYGNDDVANLRIVTGRMFNGMPEPIAAVIRLPSHFTTKGHDRDVLLSSIDVKTGRMGKGVFRNIKLPEFTHHPDTGHPIEGRILWRWSEMLNLTLRAHATCPWMPFVGWDVVDSDHGLMLLEANAFWGGDSAQLPDAPPLGQTRFPEIYFDWFERIRALQGGQLQVPISPDQIKAVGTPV
jgi:hypothetical protein